MVRTEDTIPRLPRAVAELTRFLTVGLLDGSLLASAGLSDVDFFMGEGCGTLLVDERKGLFISCWVSGLLLVEPVVLELVSTESLLFFCVGEEIRSAARQKTNYVPLSLGLPPCNPAHRQQSLWAALESEVFARATCHLASQHTTTRHQRRRVTTSR